MSTEYIVRKFLELCEEPSDMKEHMRTLRDYSFMCDSVTEFGVCDCTSTWALLAGKPYWMRSYDILRRSEVDEVEFAAKDSGTDFQFILGSSIEVTIQTTDLLFIDSLHTYEHLTKELEMHSDRVNRFIILHDTTIFGDHDEAHDGPGLWPAVEKLLEKGVWKVRERFTNWNGLTILQKS